MNEHFVSIPQHVEIMDSATRDFVRYQGADSEADALKRMIDVHLQHMRDTLRDVNMPVSGGVFITEIAGYDLTIVDGWLDDERSVQVFSRSAARAIWQLLQQMGKQAETVH